jgi:hypothetical protein
LGATADGTFWRRVEAKNCELAKFESVHISKNLAISGLSWLHTPYQVASLIE